MQARSRVSRVIGGVLALALVPFVAVGFAPVSQAASFSIAQPTNYITASASTNYTYTNSYPNS